MVACGMMLLGGLTEWVGAPSAVVIGNGIYLVFVIWLAVTVPMLRRLDGRALTA